MSKTIAVTTANASKIAALLAQANGRATSHTYGSYLDVERLAQAAEQRALALVGAKKSLPGAQYSCTSGDAVPNAYKYGRKATHLTLVRKSSDWHLVPESIRETLIYKEGGGCRLVLTAEQDAAAIAALRKGYSVDKQTAAPANAT